MLLQLQQGIIFEDILLFSTKNWSFVDLQYIFKEVTTKRNTLGHSVCRLFQVLAQFSLNTSEMDLGFFTRKLMSELPHKFSNELSLGS